MPTVKELIDRYGDKLIGMKLRWPGDAGTGVGVFTVDAVCAGNILATHDKLGVQHRFTPDDVFELLPEIKSGTVRSLVQKYGRNLVGQKSFWAGDSRVILGVDVGRLTFWVQGRLYEADDLANVEAPPSLTPTTKTPFELLDLGFAAAMCECWKAGVKGGRKPDDWQFLPGTDETKERYVAKVLRHLKRYVEGGSSEHLAAIACNANILWHLEGRGE